MVLLSTWFKKEKQASLIAAHHISCAFEVTVLKWGLGRTFFFFAHVWLKETIASLGMSLGFFAPAQSEGGRKVDVLNIAPGAQVSLDLSVRFPRSREHIRGMRGAEKKKT